LPHPSATTGLGIDISASLDCCKSTDRKRENVDSEGEFIPGETIVKLYYRKRLDGYMTIPGASLFKAAADLRRSHG
jgi:hypothetical protein